jgi:hypothetical protein
VRLAFRGEFAPGGEFAGHHRLGEKFLIVIATAERDHTGQPANISRSLYRFEGGHA